MSAVGEAFVSAIIGEVVKVGLALLRGKYIGHGSIESELQGLTIQLPRIKAMVEAAEGGDVQVTGESLRDWLWMLKDALYNADDVLDELKYIDLAKQVTTLAMQDSSCCSPMRLRALAKNSVSRMRHAAYFCCGQLLESDPLLKKLREVIKNLHQVAAAPDLTDFHSLVKDVKEKQQHEEEKTIEVDRMTTAMLTNRRVVGRHEEKEEIIWWLMQSNDDVRLLSIVGHGGMGKTTLAQFVLEDDRIKTFFDPVMWAYVSPSFDVMRIMREILESARSRRPEVDTLTGLQDALKDLLKSLTKKFLLVLDDAWDDKHPETWEKLLAPLNSASKGGRILLTTRSPTVTQVAEQAVVCALASERSPMKTINLGGLDKNEYLELFNRHVFLGKDKDSHPRLLSIGKEIADKLGGSPLLAKVVGGMLNINFGDTEYWNIIRSHSIQGDAIFNLRLSYQYLSPHLRPCFALCSVFRREGVFSDGVYLEEDLVHLWMAIGLIHEDSSKEPMESIGRRYFNDLLKRSFFEPSGSNYLDGPGYMMHDLLYELAESVSQDECFTFTYDKQVEEIPTRIRHLRINTFSMDIILKVEKLVNLRTLSLSYYGSAPEQHHAECFSKILRSSPSLRVLILDIPFMVTLPETIGGLRHLRYLRVRHRVEQWPLSLSKLYYLQTLKLGENSTLPDITSLINLRHLKPVDLSANLPGVGKLIALQELEFHVRKKSGLKIEELKGLKQLRKLSIDGLENVMSFEEAREARIHEKEYMKVLVLRWHSQNEEYDPEVHEQVLKGLNPNSSLETLTIQNYCGVSPPSWMDPRSLNELESIELSHCRRLAQLSPLGKLNCLTKLYLRYMPGVKVIGPLEGFQQLQVLDIGQLFQLEKLCEQPGPSEETSSWCPRLCQLHIVDCFKLVALPLLPLCLEQLSLWRVELTALPKLWLRNGDNESSMCTGSSSSSSLLSEVSISGCRQLNSLSNSFLQQQHHLRALRKLEVLHCEELMYLPVGGFGHLCSLQEMTLAKCPKLRQPQLEPAETTSYSATANVCHCFLPASLKVLRFDDCGEMERSLPTILKGAVSLSRLDLYNCKNMTSLPPADLMATLTSLTEIRIVGCYKLASLDGLNALRLDSLSIKDCRALLLAGAVPPLILRYMENWWDTSNFDESLGGPSAPYLDSPSIVECPELLPADEPLGGSNLPYLDSSSVDECPELLPADEPAGGSNAPSLDSSSVEECPELLPAGAVPPVFCSNMEDGNRSSFAVRMLRVDHPTLLLIEPVKSLTSVQVLEILAWGIESLDEVEAWLLQNRTSLVRLELHNAYSLVALPTCIESLTSLEHLELREVRQLRSLPLLFPSLKHLEIWGCDLVLAERLHDGGADWPHIKHIPNIMVSLSSKWSPELSD